MNQKITKKWLDYAKADLEGAEVLLKSAKSHWSYQLCVWHCHQAIEKLLKTVIVKNGDEVKKIHDLIRLSKDSQLELPEEFQEYIDKLNPHYQPPRYPDIPYKGPVLRYSKEIAKSHLQKTKEIFLCPVGNYLCFMYIFFKVSRIIDCMQVLLTTLRKERENII